MTLRFLPYTIELKQQFTIAAGSRSSTPAVLVRADCDGIAGYGEASMPPYLGESVESAAAFLSKVNLAFHDHESSFEQLLEIVNSASAGNSAAKAGVDIALHDWYGKKRGFAWHRHWDLDPNKIPFSSYTISIDTRDGTVHRVREASDFPILKVKLGGPNDKEAIETIRAMTDAVIRVDVNQAWVDRSEALKSIEWLATKNVELVEQPMPRDKVDDLAWLTERSPLPIVADEGVQSLADVRAALGVYHGVNVKLMKCGGMREARRMIQLAESLGLKVMVGCMTETSCGISAAAQLAAMADWVDLDGALLINNDPFTGVKVEKGKVVLSGGYGIGLSRVSEKLLFDHQQEEP